MRRSPFRSLLLLLAALTAAGCSPSPTVRSEISPAANFAAVRSYNWVPTSSAPPAGQRLPGIGDWRVRNDVDADLSARGWALLPGPDVLVDYGVMREYKQAESFSDYAAYVGEGGRQGLAGAGVQGYEEGTLVLHLYDGRTGQLLWRASASAVIGGDDDTALLSKAIADMLSRLPRN